MPVEHEPFVLFDAFDFVNLEHQNKDYLHLLDKENPFCRCDNRYVASGSAHGNTISISSAA